MPFPYNPSIYRTNSAQTPPPNPVTINGMLQAVEACTTQLQTQPYSPDLWAKRSAYYLALNYSELAVGDAYKATLLLSQVSREGGEADVNHESSENESSIRTKAYEILGQALYDCHCHVESLEFWEDVSKKEGAGYGQEKVTALKELLGRKKEATAEMGGNKQEQLDRLRDGGVTTVLYPWMAERHLKRSSETVTRVNEELKNSAKAQTCYVSTSTLPSGDDTLGVFASRPISSGELILLDCTTTGTCSTPAPNSC